MSTPVRTSVYRSTIIATLALLPVGCAAADDPGAGSGGSFGSGGFPSGSGVPGGGDGDADGDAGDTADTMGDSGTSGFGTTGNDPDPTTGDDPSATSASSGGSTGDAGTTTGDTTTGGGDTTAITGGTDEPACGDGFREGDEACDGNVLGGATCVSEGFDGGAIACSDTCTLDTSGCSTCGNATAEAEEVCDGADLRMETCESQGFDGGTLACDATCSDYVVDGCTQVACGDGVRGGQRGVRRLGPGQPDVREFGGGRWNLGLRG